MLRCVRSLRWTARGLALALAAAVLLGACHAGGGKPRPAGGGRPGITVASFDFAESEILAQIYAQALMKRGLPVDLLPKLGSREIVEPALEQGRVNFVPEYMGTSLDFLSRDTHAATADAPATYAKLRAALASRGIVALRYAPGQDANGFAVTAATARRLHLRRLSDLAPIASQLVFGGPPECPSRPLCLAGLQDRYGLHFKQFKPMPTRSVTADALEMGEIDIGLLETTNGNLATRQFTLLEDDRGLQPAENVVPIARRALVDAYGAELTAPVDAITARLTTATLAGLNQRVEVGHEAPAQVAADWLQREGLAA